VPPHFAYPILQVGDQAHYERIQIQWPLLHHSSTLVNASVGVRQTPMFIQGAAEADTTAHHDRSSTGLVRPPSQQSNNFARYNYNAFSFCAGLVNSVPLVRYYIGPFQHPMLLSAATIPDKSLNASSIISGCPLLSSVLSLHLILCTTHPRALCISFCMCHTFGIGGYLNCGLAHLQPVQPQKYHGYST
jgi:hypothetical protein